MSARTQARHVQKSARAEGLSDSYQRIFQLVVHHWNDIVDYKHQRDVHWNEAADAVVLPVLRRKAST